MTKRIAIEVGATELRAVWIESSALRWHAQAALPDAQALPAALQTLLSARPSVLSRARATIVLSPRWVQTRKLQGLPSLGSSRLAEQLLRENEQAFFLWNGRPSTLVAHIAADGAAWGAAFDGELLDAIVHAARSAHMGIVEVAPSVGAIAAACSGRSVVWRDGEHAFRIQGDQTGLVRLERVVDRENCDYLPIAEALRPVGADADRFAGAYAAAICRRGLPLAWRPHADPVRLRRRNRIINIAAGIALLWAAAAAILAPGIRARVSTRESERELRRYRTVQQELSSVETELRRVSESLDRVAGFAMERGRITRTIGALSEATPESTAILDIRIDSTEGRFTAIAPQVADVLPALADAAEIVAPQIVGSVMRETIAGTRLERAAFRFRRPSAMKERRR